MPKGYTYIVSTGYDPEKGRHVKDPYLGEIPTMGACMPNIRKRLEPGDFIFPVSGKIKGINQFIMGGFEVAEIIDATQAYKRFPEQHLRKREDGQLDGNIIFDEKGNVHPLDTHKNAAARRENYIVGNGNSIVLRTSEEIARGRAKTMEIFQLLFGKSGQKPIDILGRGGRKLDEQQIADLIKLLQSLKTMEREIVRRAAAGQGLSSPKNRGLHLSHR
jgi:hypothetical protein